jgi:hypothetical protein
MATVRVKIPTHKAPFSLVRGFPFIGENMYKTVAEFIEALPSLPCYISAKAEQAHKSLQRNRSQPEFAEQFHHSERPFPLYK